MGGSCAEVGKIAGRTDDLTRYALSGGHLPFRLSLRQLLQKVIVARDKVAAHNGRRPKADLKGGNVVMWRLAEVTISL